MQSAEVGQVLFAQVGRLEPGDAQLADETFYDVYAFEGQAGAVLSMTLESLDFDAYLWLIAPNGEKLAENDDVAAGNLNSWLTVTLPTTGTLPNRRQCRCPSVPGAIYAHGGGGRGGSQPEPSGPQTG